LAARRLGAAGVFAFTALGGKEELPHVLVEGLLRGGIHEVQPQLVDHHDFHAQPLVPAVGADALPDLVPLGAGEGAPGESRRVGPAAAGAVDGLRAGFGHQRTSPGRTIRLSWRSRTSLGTRTRSSRSLSSRPRRLFTISSGTSSLR